MLDAFLVDGAPVGRIIIQSLANMNQGKYVFSQIVKFLPQRYFERLVQKYNDKTQNMQTTLQFIYD